MRLDLFLSVSAVYLCFVKSLELIMAKYSTAKKAVDDMRRVLDGKTKIKAGGGGGNGGKEGAAVEGAGMVVLEIKDSR